MYQSALLLGLLFLVSACGGGGGGSSDSAPAPVTSGNTQTNPDTNTGSGTSTDSGTNTDTDTANNNDSTGDAGQDSGNANPEPPAEPTITREQATVFLSQASFGATDETVAEVQSMGFEAWIDAQFDIPASSHLGYMQALPAAADLGEQRVQRMDAFFSHAINEPDQLRQRLAYALSQIMVISENSGLANTPEGLAFYYDLLGDHAFGNFRELMQAVTLNPAMGVYLSMLGNEKPDAARNIRPDENYARELMQLFTIGLVELNLDGSQILEAGQPVPTYNQAVIEGFAHVFTGWNFAGSASFGAPRINFLAPMQAFQALHDTGEKLLLNGVVLPANQTAEQDLEDALDNIFAHNNVAPFISKQLIQRLVTANPSPAYIARVATVFNNNGNNIKGDMRAVIKAILLDEEARSNNSGKLVEPLIRLIALWRAYDAAALNNRYLFANPEFFFAQAPLRSPSVFNFYSPTYAPPGEIADANLVSPEMQITNESTVSSVNDYLALAIFIQHSLNEERREDTIAIDFTEHLDASNDAETLLNDVSLKLLGTETPAAIAQVSIEQINLIPLDEPTFRVSEAIHAIATSLEFATIGSN